MMVMQRGLRRASSAAVRSGRAVEMRAEKAGMR
jgi:hypothetical protein